MNQCLQKQPSSPHLPLPDYVDSAAVLDEIRAGARLTAAVANRRRSERADAGTGASAAARSTIGCPALRGARLRKPCPLRRQPAAQRGGTGAKAWANGPERWSPAALSAATRDVSTGARLAAGQPRDVAVIKQEREAFELERGARDCEANRTYGGVLSDGRPYLWVARGCRGIFRCQGSVLRCGLFIYGEFLKLVAAREAGRGRLTICSCDRTESLTAQRHWRDGRDHLANAAIGTVVPYRDPSLNRSARGVASL